MAGGQKTAQDIETALAEAGSNVSQIHSALDFGCGCGRLLLDVVRRWPHIHWTGSDVDARGIQWCAANLSAARVLVNPALPPLPFADGEFDLIWCGSVFTHLDEEPPGRVAQRTQTHAGPRRPSPRQRPRPRLLVGPAAAHSAPNPASAVSSSPASPATKASTPTGTRPPGTRAITSTNTGRASSTSKPTSARAPAFRTSSSPARRRKRPP